VATGREARPRASRPPGRTHSGTGPSYRSGVTTIRVLVIAIIVAIIAVALLPLGVLLDLAGGGDGFGLCTGGIGDCRTSYFDGPELLGVLGLVLFLLLMALRAALHVRSLAETRRDDQALDESMGGGDRVGRGDRLGRG